MNCPLCQSASKFIFTAKGIPVHDCRSCRHRFANIATNQNHASTVYDDSYFNGGGAGYSNYLAESALLIKHGRNYAKKLARYVKKRGKLLDVGSAAGFILQGFINEGWQGAGIEPNAAMAREGRKRFGLDVRTGPFETFQSDERFYLITMIQVAAHFYNPAAAFEKAYNHLEKGGFLLIETWDYRSLSARLFGKHWHEYSPPSVLHWFSEKHLTRYLEHLGFTRTAKGRPLKKISGAHAKSLLKYRLGNSPFLSIIPNNLVFPYPSEDLFWALYQK